MEGFAATAHIPSRLHHNAYVVRDQRTTQRFYEGLLGLPLIATWTEVDELFGAERVYCHTFYGLGDGGALAFFQFADPDDHAQFEPQFRPSPFIHLALKVDDATQQLCRPAAGGRWLGALHPGTWVLPVALRHRS